MTAALIASPPAYLCVRCNAPWQPGAERCAECERRAANTPEAQVVALRAQLAAVTAERDALRAAAAEHVAATAARNDAFESARAISANSAAFAELTAAWESHAAAIGRAQNALAALNALLPTERPS